MVLAFITMNVSAATKEVLLRLPLISDKNAAAISDALAKIEGVSEVSANYELKVLIVTYDDAVINDENVLLNLIIENAGNTSVEKINSSDIKIIRRNYSLTVLSHNDKPAK
jgi:copper chaperone CopZ